MKSFSRTVHVTALALALLASGCGDTSPGGDESPTLPSVDGPPSTGNGPATGTNPGAPANVDPLVVETDKGTIRGKAAGSGFAFLGIPYAKPPVGSLRFMPPVAADPWSDVKDATTYGSTCVQTPLKKNQTAVAGSEDCLTLNVWTPSVPSTSNEPLPVLAYMHGGFYVAGANNQPGGEAKQNLYDGQALANANHAVVVVFNYRLGVLGWLAHPALAAANPHHTTGNYGLLDVILGLRWVQDNIAAFNGDKSRVMLFGESAGATGTCAIVSSPLARGLFSSALLQSGNCAAETAAFRATDQAGIVKALKCSGSADMVACLQGAPLSAIVESGGNEIVDSLLAASTINVDPVHFMSVAFSPTVDGYALTDVPLETIRAGKHNHVALAIGTNAQEMNWLLPQSLVPAVPVVSCVTFTTFVSAMFPGLSRPGLAAKLLATYPCSPLNAKAGYDALVALTSDAFFTCPSRRALRAAAATQSEPVYRYFYEHTHSSGAWAPLGAAHAGEIPFVWGTFPYFDMTPTAAETTLSQQVQAYWSNLARSGNPNGTGLPLWKAYDSAADNTLQLSTPIEETTGVNAKACDLWDTVQ